MKLDFVFHPDIVEDVSYLLFEFGKWTVISWAQPFVFCLPPKGLRQIQMRRISRQKQDIQIFFHPSLNCRQKLFRPMRRRIIQYQNGWFLQIPAKIIYWLNQKIRINILRAFITDAKIIRAKYSKQIDFPVSLRKDFDSLTFGRPAIGQFRIHRKRTFVAKIQIYRAAPVKPPQTV